MAVKIVTDEVSNMDKETAEKFRISIIPYLITDDDGKEVRISTDSNIYNPQEDIHNIRNFSTLDDYYNFLGKIKNKNEAPGTAAPDIERCRRFLQTTIEKEEGDICCIILASNLSRIYEYFKIAALEVGKEFNRRIEVIDSKQAFDPLGLLAIEASRMSKLGKNLQNR